MRAWPEPSPSLHGVLTGVFFAACMTVINLITEHIAWDRAAPGAAAGGAVVGAVTWVVVRSARAKLRDVLAGLGPEQRRAVLQAASRGPAPREPELRAAAAELVRRQLIDETEHQGFAFVFFAILALASVLGAVIGSPWYAVCAVVFAAALVMTVRSLTTLRRRLARLEAVG
jgi:Flp pilus assembly protein TadB